MAKTIIPALILSALIAGPAAALKPVTDPPILAQLNAPETDEEPWLKDPIVTAKSYTLEELIEDEKDYELLVEITYSCNFTQSNEGKKDEMQLSFLLTGGTRQPTGETFTYQKAYMIGNAGTAGLQLLGQNERQFNLIERTNSGNINYTTILRDGSQAVHSRHVVMSGGLLPTEIVSSQYVGSCEVKI